MGVAGHVVGAQADARKHVRDAIFEVASGGETVDAEWFADDLFEGHAGVE